MDSRKSSIVLSMGGLFISLLLALLAGCVSAPSLPRGLGVPAGPSPTFFPAVFVESTMALDCVSTALKRGNADKKKQAISLGMLGTDAVAPQTSVATKLGTQTDLPLSLRPFVRTAFDRISSGFVLVNNPPRDGKRAEKEEKPAVVPGVVLDGSIYVTAPHRVIGGEAEALGFGLGSKVESHDIGLQMYWSMAVPDFSGYQQSGTSVSLVIRVYSTEQGSSAFRITSGSNGLLLANSRAIQDLAPHFALQEAVNLAVAELVRSFASRYMDIYVGCGLPEVVAREKYNASSVPIVGVTLIATATKVCARLSAHREIAHRVQEPPLLRVTEYSAEGFKVAEQIKPVAPLSSLLSGPLICIDRATKIHATTEQIQIEVITSQNGSNHVLGGNSIYLQ